MNLNSRKQVYKHDMCLGCGLCTLANNVIMVQRHGRYLPSVLVDNEIIENSCPARGYNIKEEGHKLFGNVNYRYEIGYYRRLCLAHSTDNEILENASSGGVMTQIAHYLLSNKLVDGVISNKFVYNENVVRTETFIAYSLEQLLEGQGSKYCPTSTLSILTKLEKGKKYLLIGTPCQIAGFRKYAAQRPEINQQIPYTIANFCGGYRDFRELDYFVKDIAHIENVHSFRHRGGGQPGSMRIIGKNGEIFQYPYPKYAKLSSFVKNERCTLCMDATGELADFSCGDAWLDSRDNTAAWSIIVARSLEAEKVLDNLSKNSFLDLRADITEEDLIYSQKSNITSKKYRQFKRLKVRDALMFRSPNWYDNFPIKQGTFLGELRVILSKAMRKLL